MDGGASGKAAAGCDNTAVAVQERVAEERAEMRAEIQVLKSDVRAAEQRADRQAQELQEELTNPGEEVRDAGESKAESSKQAMQSTAEQVGKGARKSENPRSERRMRRTRDSAEWPASTTLWRAASAPPIDASN